MADETATVIKTYVINFDRTYNVDSVEEFLEKARKPVATHGNKTYIIFETEAATQPLNARDQVAASLDGKTYNLGILVLHVDESRLNVNEPGAAIGLHSVYQALRNCTGDRVIVLIGGDDSKKRYENDVHSSTVRSKLYSQLSEDYMYGKNGFLFSWNDWSKPAPQHIDALRKFCLRQIRGKYEYKPPSSRSGNQTYSDYVQQLQNRDNESSPLLMHDGRCQQYRKRVILVIIVSVIILMGIVTGVLLGTERNSTHFTTVIPSVTVHNTPGGGILRTA